MMRTLPTILLALVAVSAAWMSHPAIDPASRVPVDSRPLAQGRPADLAARAAEGPVRVIVRLDVPTGPEGMLGGEAAIAKQRDAIARAQDAVFRTVSDNVRTVTRFVTLPAFAATIDRAGLTELAAIPSVAAIEADDVLTPSLLETPAIVRANVLWGQGTEGSGWKVAILDSGVETSHSFFSGRVTSEACYSTTDPALGATSLCPGGVSSSIVAGAGVNCTGTLGCEHGTQVAGIAAGRTGSFAGMARGARVVSIQIYSRIQGAGLCANQTAGPCLRSFESNIISALDRVLVLAGPGNPGRIGAVNLSASSFDPGAPGMGGGVTGSCDSTNSAFTQAVENLRSVGIPTVVPSGNNSLFNALTFPACVSRVISVGATAKTGAFQPFSNRSSLLSLVAPGVSVQTSTLNNLLQTVTGTSYAAAHVSGGWTLLKSRAPNATVDTVLQALRLTGTPTPDSQSGLTFSSILLDRAAGSMGGPGSPTSVLVSVVGSAVSASWSNPFDGTIPSGFRLELLSQATGGTLASLDVGLTYSFATTMPDGVYLLRVRSLTPAGPGAASSDVAFFVGPPPVTSPPFVPTDLRAEVTGSQVRVTWNLTADSPPASSFVAEVGSASGLNDLAVIDTGSSAPSLVATGVRPGTYFVRIRSKNALGTSGLSNELRIDVIGGECAAPTPPTGLSASVAGSLVTLSWTAPLLGGVITAYTLEVGSGSGLANVLQTTFGPQTVIAGNLASGLYFARVRTHSACGVSGPSNEVIIVVP